MGEMMGDFPSWTEGILCDLDGTLVETELLKARSYARVVQGMMRCTAQDRLGVLDDKANSGQVLQRVKSESSILLNSKRNTSDSSGQQCADAAMRIFLSNLGATSEFIAKKLVEDLDLGDQLDSEMKRFNVSEPWQALYKLRKETYYESFATPENLYNSRYPATIEVIKKAAAQGLPMALCTSSSTDDATRVLKALGTLDLFKFVLGRDKVKHSKPDPEIYLKGADLLAVNVNRCFIFEDSVTGIKSGVAAGACVVPIASEFTAESLREQAIIPQDRIAFESDGIWPIISAATVS